MARVDRLPEAGETLTGSGFTTRDHLLALLERQT